MGETIGAAASISTAAAAAAAAVVFTTANVARTARSGLYPEQQQQRVGVLTVVVGPANGNNNTGIRRSTITTTGRRRRKSWRDVYFSHTPNHSQNTKGEREKKKKGRMGAATHRHSNAVLPNHRIGPRTYHSNTADCSWLAARPLTIIVCICARTHSHHMSTP